LFSHALTNVPPELSKARAKASGSLPSMILTARAPLSIASMHAATFGDIPSAKEFFYSE
jgi:hypothetical protein